MSILKYFTSNKTSTGKEDDAIFTSLESSGVSSKEYENIEETIKPAEKAKKKKKITYKEEGKMKITKYANLYGIANAVRRYSKEYPNISESTVHDWLNQTRNSYFCVTSKNHWLMFVS